MSKFHQFPFNNTRWYNSSLIASILLDVDPSKEPDITLLPEFLSETGAYEENLVELPIGKFQQMQSTSDSPSFEVIQTGSLWIKPTLVIRINSVPTAYSVLAVDCCEIQVLQLPFSISLADSIVLIVLGNLYATAEKLGIVLEPALITRPAS